MNKIDKDTLQLLSERDRTVYNRTLSAMSVWDYLVACGVALEGHFVFTGGGHGNIYINIRDLNTIMLLSPIAMQIAFDVRNDDFDAVVGTPYGADTLAVLVAHYYEQFTDNTVEILKPLKDGGKLVWYKDHGDRVQSTKLLQVEDVINSAKSLCETVEFIQSSGGELLVIYTVCNRRSNKNPGLKVLQNKFSLQRAVALTEVDAVNYDVDIPLDIIGQCPLCRDGVPIDMRVGHGVKFLAQIKDMYPVLYDKLKV